MSELLGNPMLVQVGVLAAAGLAAVALVMGIRYLIVSRPNVLKERVQRAVGGAAGDEAEALELSTPHRRRRDSTLVKIFGGVSRLARPTSPAELGRLRGKLSHAGFRGEGALATYLATKILVCLFAGGVVLWLNAMRVQALQNLALWVVAAMIVGFYLPAIWLHGRVKERQQKINRALPDALDLIVTCVEGGLGLDAAMNRVADELRLSAPLLSAELSQTSLEMRAGIERSDAFRRLANRTGVEELRNLAAVIIQTELFGTSIAHSLRVMAESMRIRRTQRAEERAATVGVKLTVPLIFCIVPALFAVLMGPAVVQILRLLLPTLRGGR